LKYNLERYLTRNTDGYQINGTANWMINQANFVTLTGSYFYTQTHYGPEFDGILFDEMMDTVYPPEVIIPKWYEFLETLRCNRYQQFPLCPRYG